MYECHEDLAPMCTIGTLYTTTQSSAQLEADLLMLSALPSRSHPSAPLAAAARAAPSQNDSKCLQDAQEQLRYVLHQSIQVVLADGRFDLHTSRAKIIMF